MVLTLKEYIETLKTDIAKKQAEIETIQAIIVQLDVITTIG